MTSAKFKTAAKTFGNGLLTATTVLANSGVQLQINEIDAEIQEKQDEINALQERRSELKARLV